MNTLRLTLITGRTLKQAHGMHCGKDTQTYRDATEIALMHPDDMASIGLADGQPVSLRSDHGRTRALAVSSDTPQGLVFVPMGPTANALIGPDTEGTGMPAFKGITVDARGA